MQGKPPRDSIVRMTEIVLPSDTNMLGNIFGGTVMRWIDIAGALASRRHCRKIAVTVSLDRLDFLSPIKLGDTVVIESKVIYAGKTSMDAVVTVESEDITTGLRNLTSKAYITFVAIDNNGKPTSVPPIVPETEEEKQAFEEARKRRAERKRLHR